MTAQRRAACAFGMLTLAACTSGEAPPGPHLRSRYGIAQDWSTRGGRLFNAGHEVRIAGLNWFGLEGPARAPHGLWAGRSLTSFCTQVRSLGFNALRVPLSPEAIRTGFPAAPWAQEQGLATGRRALEALLDAAARERIFVLLDFQTCASTRTGATLPGRPDGCLGYTLADWQSDLRELARLSLANPIVMGIDLFNEPSKLAWDTWARLAERAGTDVLMINPSILVFVEGVGASSSYDGPGVFDGENLRDAGRRPVDLPLDRVVYSPHTYGPSVSDQAYFHDARYPGNMPEIWGVHFGYLAREGAAAVVIGEFGGSYSEGRGASDRAWQDAFVGYLARERYPGYFYWALNPNAGGTGGLLEDDWRTVDERKLRLLAPLAPRRPAF